MSSSTTKYGVRGGVPRSGALSPKGRKELGLSPLYYKNVKRGDDGGVYFRGVRYTLDDVSDDEAEYEGDRDGFIDGSDLSSKSELVREMLTINEEEKADDLSAPSEEECGLCGEDGELGSIGVDSTSYDEVSTVLSVRERIKEYGYHISLRFGKVSSRFRMLGEFVRDYGIVGGYARLIEYAVRWLQQFFPLGLYFVLFACKLFYDLTEDLVRVYTNLFFWIPNPQVRGYCVRCFTYSMILLNLIGGTGTVLGAYCVHVVMWIGRLCTDDFFREMMYEQAIQLPGLAQWIGYFTIVRDELWFGKIGGFCIVGDENLDVRLRARVFDDVMDQHAWYYENLVDLRARRFARHRLRLFMVRVLVTSFLRGKVFHYYNWCKSMVGASWWRRNCYVVQVGSSHVISEVDEYTFGVPEENYYMVPQSGRVKAVPLMADDESDDFGAVTDSVAKEDVRRRKSFVHLSVPVNVAEKHAAYRHLRVKRAFPDFQSLFRGEMTREEFRKKIDKSFVQLLFRCVEDKQTALWLIEEDKKVRANGVLSRMNLQAGVSFGMFEDVLCRLFPSAGDARDLVRRMKGFMDRCEELQKRLLNLHFINLMTGIGLLIKAVDFSSQVLAITNIATNILEMPDIGDKVRDCIEILMMPVPQAPLADMIQDGVRKLASSGLPAKLSALVTAFLGTGVFRWLGNESKMIVTMMQEYAKGMGKDFSFLMVFVETLKLVSDGIAEFCETWNPLSLLGLSPRRSMLMECFELIKYFKSYRSQNPGKAVGKEKVEISPITLIEKSSKLLPRMSKYLSEHKDVEFFAAYNALLIEKLAQENAQDSIRNEPYGVLLFGDPGSGKTNLPQFVAPVLLHQLGLDKSINCTYTETGHEFTDRPGVTLQYVVDDLFMQKHENTTTETDPMEKIVRLINSHPFSPNCAAVEDKNIRAAPLIVYFNTNVKEYEFTKCTSSVGRLPRRLDLVEYVYTEKARQYAREQQIPLEQVMQCDVDVSEFVVYRFRKMTISVEAEKTVLFTKGPVGKVFTNLGELINEIVTRALHKRAKQTAFHEKVRKTCENGYPLYGNHPKLCSCGYIPQGGICPRRVRPVDGVEAVKGVFGEMLPRVSANLENAFPGAEAYFREVVADPRVVEAAQFAAALGGVSVVMYALYKMAPNVTAQAKYIRDIGVDPNPSNVVVCETQNGASYIGGSSLPPRVSITRSAGISVWAQPLQPNMYLVPQHFWGDIPKTNTTGFPPAVEGEEIILEVDGIKHREVFSRRFVLPIPPHDKSILVLPFATHPAVRKYWMTRIAPNDYEGPAVFKGANVNVTSFRTELGLISYSFPTKAGDCGLEIRTPSGLLIGIHIAELHGLCIGARVSKEDVDYLVANMRRQGKYVPCFASEHPMIHLPRFKQMYSEVGPSERSAYGWLLKKGQIPSNLRHTPILHKKFIDKCEMTGRRSPMYPLVADVVGEYSPPMGGKTVVVDGEYVNGVSLRYRAFAGGGRIEDPEALELAMQCIIEKMPTPPQRLEPLSDVQAVVGDLRNTYINPMKAETSAGPVYEMKGIPRTKLFEEKGEGRFQPHDEWEKDFRDLTAMLESGWLWPFVVRANYKDEIIALAKALAGKTRLFYIPDKCANAKIRQWLLPILAWLIQNGIQMGLAAAINPGSDDWRKLFEKLNAFGRDRWFCSDQRFFDITQFTLIVAIAELMSRLARKCGYDEEGCYMVFKCCVWYLYQWMLIEGELHEVFGGLPSGIAFTLILNSILNQLQSYYCLFRHNRKVPPTLMLALTYIVTQGDDKIMAVSRDLVFNGELLVKSDAELGAITTHEVHKDRPPDFCDSDEATLMKRSFVRHRGYILAPLAEASIWKAIGYVCGKMTPSEEEKRNKDVLMCMSYEAFMHGEVFYNCYCERFKALSYCPMFHSYDDLWNKYTLGTLILWDPDGDYIRPSTVDIHDLAIAAWSKLDSAYELWETMASGLHYESGGKFTPDIISSIKLTELSSTSDITVTVNTGEMAAVKAHVVEESFATAKELPLEVRDTVITGTELQSYLKQKFNLGLFTLNTNAAVATNVMALALTNNPRLNSIAGTYMSYRYKSIRVSGTYMGDPKTLGSVKVSVVPFGHNATSATNNPMTSVWAGVTAPATLAQLPGWIVDIAKPCDCSITLPWAGPVPLFPVANGYDYGIVFNVYGGLGNIMGVTQPTVKMRMWVEFEDLQFVALNPQSGDERKPNTSTRALAYAKQAAKGMGWFISPVMAVFRVGLAIGEALGFSKPVFGVDSKMITTRTELALMSGSAMTGTTLGSDPAQAVSVEGLIPGAVKGETNLRFISSKPGILTYALADNTNLCIHPCQVVSTAAAPPSYISYTPVGFAVSCFRYWRGTLKVRLTWFSTPLVRGFARITIIPPGGTSSPTNPLSGRYITQEVLGTTSVVLEFPWEYNTMMMPVLAPVNPIVSTLYPNIYWAWDVTPITNAGATLDILPVVEIWCEDLETEIPQLNQPTGETGHQLNYQGVRKGEATDDLLLLTRRMCFNYQIVPNVTAVGNPITIPAEPVLGNITYPTACALNNVCPTFLTWVRQAYYGCTGGVNIMFLSTDAGSASEKLYYAETRGYAFGIGATPAENAFTYATIGTVPVTSTGQALIETGSGRVVNIPDRFSVAFRPGASDYVVSGGGSGTTVDSELVLVDPVGTTTSKYNVYFAGADDFQVGWWMCAPVFKWT